MSKPNTFFEPQLDPAEELLTQYSLILDLPKGDPTVKLAALTVLDFALDWRNKLYLNAGSLAHQYLVDLRFKIESYGESEDNGKKNPNPLQ